MERYPVNPDASPATSHSTSSRTHAWDAQTASPAFPTLADHMGNLLGSDTEPDPLFFVETWTFGVDAAAQNFQARHPSTPHFSSASSTHHSFNFSVPLIFVQEVLPNTSPAPNDFSPAGFHSAWKDAYGAANTSSHKPQPNSDGPRREETFTSASGVPLTAEEACRMLGVSCSSNRKQIKSAYRQLVWRYHPDRLEHASENDQRAATDRMTSINEAYRLLCGSALHSI